MFKPSVPYEPFQEYLYNNPSVLDCGVELLDNGLAIHYIHTVYYPRRRRRGIIIHRPPGDSTMSETGVITPTVGRHVDFWPNGALDGPLARMASLDDKQPFMAEIVYVWNWNDRLVNVIAYDHNGNGESFTSINLLQEGDEKPEKGQCYCSWMPYQVNVAKTEALDARTATEVVQDEGSTTDKEKYDAIVKNNSFRGQIALEFVENDDPEIKRAIVTADSLEEAIEKLKRAHPGAVFTGVNQIANYFEVIQ